MADQLSPAAAKKSKKKGGGLVTFVRDLIKRPGKSAKDSASQSNSTQVSVSAAFGTQDSAQGNDVGSPEPTDSSKCIDSIFVYSTMTRPFRSAGFRRRSRLVVAIRLLCV